MTGAEVAQLLSQYRLPLHDERATQSEIASALDHAGVAHEREVRLSAADIIDFMVGEVGIEVKLRGTSKTQIYRQLERYAQHAAVRELVLATNTSMGLPPLINGRPAHVLSLGRAWL